VLQSLVRKKEQKESEAKLKKLKNKEKVVDLENAVDRSNQFEKDLIESSKDNQEFGELLNNESSHKEKRKYMKELRKVLEASDVIMKIFMQLNIILWNLDYFGSSRCQRPIRL